MKRILSLFLVILTLLAAMPAMADGQAYNAYWIIPDGDTRLLTEAELWNYTRETLRFIRNELLARYGWSLSGRNAFLAVPLLTGAVFLLCAAVVWLLRKIPVFGRLFL